MDAADIASDNEAAYLAARLHEQRRAAALDEPGSAICADCQEEIPLERRRALPSAIHCINCQEFIERLGLNRKRRAP